MKYSSGPQVPTMPRDGPDSVEVRSRGGDARQFSPLAQRTSRVLESPEGTSLAVAPKIKFVTARSSSQV